MYLDLVDYFGEDYADYCIYDSKSFYRAFKKIEDTFEIIAGKFYFNLCRFITWCGSRKEKEYTAYAGEISFYDEHEKFNFSIWFKVYVYKKRTRLLFPIPVNLIEKKIEECYLDTLDFDEKLEYYSKKKGNK